MKNQSHKKPLCNFRIFTAGVVMATLFATFAPLQAWTLRKNEGGVKIYTRSVKGSEYSSAP